MAGPLNGGLGDTRVVLQPVKERPPASGGEVHRCGRRVHLCAEGNISLPE